MINPYYDAEKLDLELYSVEENLSYEFNIICFWATKDGRIFSASDSGCSCPTPFEGYTGETQKEVLPRLERVGSLDQAESIFESWNKAYDRHPIVSQDEKNKLLDWVKSKLG